MANLSKQLKKLFNEYLVRLEEEKNRPSTSYYPSTNSYRPSQCTQRGLFDGLNNNDFKGVIYFYEWSDATNIPLTFYRLKAFQEFLDRSQIYAPSYQWELIRHIPKTYVACMKNRKELIIKSNWESLKHALETEDRPSNPFRSTVKSNGSENKEPYNVQITRSLVQRPPMYREPDNKWSETEEIGDWFG